MINIRRNIAGLSVTIDGKSTLFLTRLSEELKIYPPASSKADISISFGQQNDDLIFTNNPAIHTEYKDGFSANFGQNIIRWYWGEYPIKVDWTATTPEKNWYQKTCNIQHTHPYEQIGQIFFELVFIPTLQLFFHDRFTLIHGSAIALSNNKAFIFGGTGGVGKTSLELSLVNKGYNFLADDICIVDDEGTVWSNFSWPKIYGYNTLNDDNIKKRLFRGRRKIDYLLWTLRMKFFGPNKVRRRVNPAIFFNGFVKNKSKIDSYYILFRENCNDIHFKRIDTTQSINMSIAIMKTEYAILYQHLYWHQFNRLGLGKAPFVNCDIIFKNWQKIEKKIFSNTKCFLVKVPMHYTAADLKRRFKASLPCQSGEALNPSDS